MESWKPNPHAEPFIPRRFPSHRSSGGAFHLKQLRSSRFLRKIFQVGIHVQDTSSIFQVYILLDLHMIASYTCQGMIEGNWGLLILYTNFLVLIYFIYGFSWDQQKLPKEEKISTGMHIVMVQLCLVLEHVCHALPRYPHPNRVHLGHVVQWCRIPETIAQVLPLVLAWDMEAGTIQIAYRAYLAERETDRGTDRESDRDRQTKRG